MPIAALFALVAVVLLLADIVLHATAPRLMARLSVLPLRAPYSFELSADGLAPLAGGRDRGRDAQPSTSGDGRGINPLAADLPGDIIGTELSDPQSGEIIVRISMAFRRGGGVVRMKLHAAGNRVTVTARFAPLPGIGAAAAIGVMVVEGLIDVLSRGTWDHAVGEVFTPTVFLAFVVVAMAASARQRARRETIALIGALQDRLGAAR